MWIMIKLAEYSFCIEILKLQIDKKRNGHIA